MIREYPARPLVGVGAVILRPGAVLLVRRGKPPNEDQWSIPGGAQELGETAEAAARRELLEETGLQVGGLHLAANVDSIHADQDGRIRFHYTILDFAGRWDGGEPIAGGDVRDAAFFSHHDVPALGLWHEATRVIARARAILDL